MLSEQRLAATETGINNEWGIDPEKATIGVKAGLFGGTEPGVQNENRVLQKLLQAPRYFSPPECSWPACNKCGDNNTKREIPKAKRKKPCYICGGIGHKGSRCKLVNDCLICSKKGHLAINCPSRNVKVDSTTRLCLLCGITGHDMFSCTNDYDSEDLKAIECYICRKVGHLCCVDNKSGGPREASCYKCGQSGHFGLECIKKVIICPKCGDSGHYRRQCVKVTSVKIGTVASARTARTNSRGARSKVKRRIKARLMAAVNACQSQPNRVCRPQTVGP